jgi:hypothetical protein
MITLFHLTWDCNLPSILASGLRPNFRPNKWKINAANNRSRATTFLCTKARTGYWDMTYRDGWVERPTPGARLVWLRVRVPKHSLVPDRARGEDYRGDFRCACVISPVQIRPFTRSDYAACHITEDVRKVAD